MSIQRVVLSGSTNGRPIVVNAIAASCNMVVHTAGSVTGADNVDEVWLWAIPYATATACQRQLFLQIGTDATGDMQHEIIVRDMALGAGPRLVLPGININNALKITAWATSTMDIGLVGHAFQIRA